MTERAAARELNTPEVITDETYVQSVPPDPIIDAAMHRERMRFTPTTQDLPDKDPGVVTYYKIYALPDSESYGCNHGGAPCLCK